MFDVVSKKIIKTLFINLTVVILLTYWNASSERISCVAVGTRADWVMIYNFTLRVYTAGSGTWVYTFIIVASFV